jgi:hypothetical protein
LLRTWGNSNDCTAELDAPSLVRCVSAKLHQLPFRSASKDQYTIPLEGNLSNSFKELDLASTARICYNL